MIAAIIATVLLSFGAVIAWAISFLSDGPFGWRFSAFLFASLAIAVWFLP
jgi:hypothetical protein